MNSRQSKIVFLSLSALLAIFCLGYLRYTWTSAINTVSDRALLIGRTSATTLNGEMFKQLRGISEDAGTIAYDSIKLRLSNLISADPGIRFAYILTQRDGKIYFMADSEPMDSVDYSPPGQEYTEANQETREPFTTGQALVSQPSADRWGKWVSIFVPMKNPDTGEIRAVFGLDYPAQNWNKEAISRTTEAGVIVVGLFLLLFAFYTVLTSGRKARTEGNRLKSLLASMNDLVFVLDTKLVFLEYHQPSSSELFIPPESFIGKSFDKVGFPNPAFGILKKALLEALRTNTMTMAEYSLDLPTGKLWFEVHITSLLDGIGKPIGLTCVAHNISKRKLAQEQLQFKTMILEAESEASIDGILVVNGQRQTVMTNKRFGEIWKIPPEIAATADDKKRLDFVQSQLKDPVTFNQKVEYLYTHPNETSRDVVEFADGRYFDRYSAPLIGPDGKPDGRIWFFRDITREKEIDTMKSEFVSVASHQLKTPLAGIKWVSELLLGDKIIKPNEKQVEYLKDIQTSNNRMLKLVGDLLDVSHIETGRKFNIEKKETDVAELVAIAIKTNQALADTKKIKIILCQGAPKTLLLNIDGEKIQQVFENLINNAIKYSKDGGQVEVGCEHKPNETVFSIKDQGIGIPEKQQDKVFQKFFRGENALTQATDGTGLGLYIAKAIVEAHGGKIWFESVENQGTTFYFSLSTK